MNKRVNLLLLVITIIFSVGCKQQKKQEEVSMEPRGADNIAYKWGHMAIQAQAWDTERFKPRPTVTSRYLGLISVAMFDAWSRYDETATPVYTTNVDRRPSEEHTLKNKEIAVSYAAYRALLEYYYSDAKEYAGLMKELGLDPNDMSMDPTTPIGVGNLAAKAVIEARKNDGANQYGEEEGSNGKPYFDYTGYKPVNDPDNNVDINRWQPKYFTDAKMGKFAPGCLTPYWQLVKPVAMDSASQFRPGPPPMVGSEQLAKEVKEVVDLQANLTDEQKALVEFMRDGPQSVQQAGHWFKFAQEVSIRDQHTLDEDVKMYFLNQVTAMDAFIASWDSKMYYDFARPFALVHEYYTGKEIKAWAGPVKGMQKMDGSQWRPYSPSSFLCPPFPSYTSGHSTISGGCAEALKLFTGDDHFGASVELIPGSLTETDSTFYGKKVTLEFPTFTKTAEMAGISRVMGGYHIQADNVAGLQLGRDVAHQAWKFYNEHLGK
ncbi:vanadium-dependent haloperoxidase [Aestuariibaculum sediminum]|uniref:Vanadium-dependent haloperoxidase n=1 Tax=Aestuariibaculum sediminum TaxID=2770637 RepID=A0A8J6UE00_9FLAO|nr:vanadium-dependent haloperoxidase [Aestuariibaculum sediminum]MBD0833414.1 vanadium-dependent haloperoxidase [Aestuariibaculum sediminum]